MSRKAELFSGAAAMLSHVAMLGWFFCLATINTNYSDMGLNFAPLCLLILAAYFLNCGLMRRGTPFPAFAAIQAALCTAAVFLFIKCAHAAPSGVFLIALCCVLYVLFILAAAFMAFEPTNKNGIITRFDMIAALMIIALFVNHFNPLIILRETMTMCAASMAALLLSLVVINTERRSEASLVKGSPLGGMLLVSGAVAFMALVAVAVVSFALEGFSSFSELCLRAIKAVFSALKAIATFILGIIDRVLRWLLQFASDQPLEAVDMAMDSANGADYIMEASAEIPLSFYIALGFIIAALIVLAVYRLRKARVFTVKRNYKAYAASARESGFKQAIIKAFRAFKAKLIFRVNCIRYRKTAPGLLAYCEKKTRGKLARQKDESGQHFLLRLVDAESSEAAKSALKELAMLVEKAFYANQAVSVPADVYKAVKKARF